MQTFPEISTIAAMISSRDVRFKGRTITEIRPAGPLQVGLVDDKGNQTYHDKSSLTSEQFSYIS